MSAIRLLLSGARRRGDQSQGLTVLARLTREDAGMATVEYAIGTVAAAGLGGLLLKLLTSEPVRNLIWAVIQNAVSSFLGG